MSKWIVPATGRALRNRFLWLAVLLGLLFCLSPVFAAVPEVASIIKVGSDITVEEGTRVRYAIAIGGQVTIYGTVEGDVLAVGDSVVLGGDAVVQGDVISLGGIVVQGRGAEIHGNITEINSSNFSAAITSALNEEWQGWSWIFAIISVAIFFCLLIIAMLLVILIPKPIQVIAVTIREETLRSSLWGLLGLILFVPLALLLAISVVGIVLIPLEMILVVSATLAGFIAVAQLVGRGAYAIFKKTDQGIVRETFWGLIILWILGWIPYVGWMVKVCAIVLGLGGVIFSRFGTRKRMTYSKMSPPISI